MSYNFFNMKTIEKYKLKRGDVIDVGDAYLIIDAEMMTDDAFEEYLLPGERLVTGSEKEKVLKIGNYI